MSADANLNVVSVDECGARDKLARCKRDAIYGAWRGGKYVPPGYWGARRESVYPDEQGAEAVIVGIGGSRFVFRVDVARPGWFVVTELNPITEV